MKIQNTLDKSKTMADTAKVEHRRQLNKSALQPFLQYRMLSYMLGSTAIVAVLCVAYMYFTFSDVLTIMTHQSRTGNLDSGAVHSQLTNMFRYCSLLFVVYIILLATVCIAYTQKLVGPLKPFENHIDQLTHGNYASRVVLRENDLHTFYEHAEKLNALAIKLNSEFNTRN